ncbi:hypothetical protein COB21_00160 [Candidatus Aerophobetes bacterium]|uniref:Uncharacterized protein n=1 Tax=Aerophobetes bacterium TaxID=2030807 RepID=A0A2A4X8B8_UNCAE|nr:MAG: hypothetical protein COB21_00160 [Candidatus Aerophobetes bacterium]
MFIRTVIFSLSLLFFSQSGFSEEISNTQFLRAILRGDMDKIRNISPKSLPSFLKLQDKDGHWPLHLACITSAQKDVAPIIQYLIENGVNINATRFDRMTALHLAVLTNNSEAITALSSYPQLDPNVLDKNTYTPLLYAVCKKSTPLVTALLEISTLNPNIATCDGATPLHFAAMQNSADIVQALLSSPSIDINARQHISQYAGATPLHFAALQASSKVVELLTAREEIDVHAEIASGMFKGFTPLHFAVMNPDTPQVCLIVKRLIDTGAIAKKGNTCALKSPDELTQISTVQKLLKKRCKKRT